MEIVKRVHFSIRDGGFEVKLLTFSTVDPDLLAGIKRGHVRFLYSVKTNKVLWEKIAPGDWIHSVAFSPCGKWIVFGTSDSRLLVVNVSNGKTKFTIFVDSFNTSSIAGLSFLSNGKFWCGSAIGIIYLVDLKSKQADRTFFVCGGCLTAIENVSTRDNVVLVGNDVGQVKNVKVGSKESFEYVTDYDNVKLWPVVSLKGTQKGRTFFSGHGNGTVLMFNLDHKVPMKLFHQTDASHDKLSSFFLVHNEELLITCRYKCIKVWQVKSKKCIDQIDCGEIQCASISKDENVLAVGGIGPSFTVEFYSLISDCAFSLDGTMKITFL